MTGETTRGIFEPELLDRCIACGFCLPACPTYALSSDEGSSPRGRISLMRALETGRLDADDPRLREVIRVNLEYDGMVVREAATAEEGLRALEGGDPPDLVMLDVMMPGLDGWEMLRRVREQHGLDSLPVIMFSGKADGGREKAKAGGAQAFIGTVEGKGRG